MKDQQIIKNINNDLGKDNQKKIMLRCITILPLLYTAGLFILSFVDNRGCNGMFGGLSGDCKSTTYFLWGYFSIPFAALSLAGGLSKNVIISLIGSILFLAFNGLLLLITTVDNVITIEIVSIIFSSILFSIELYLLKKK